MESFNQLYGCLGEYPDEDPTFDFDAQLADEAGVDDEERWMAHEEALELAGDGEFHGYFF